MSDKNTKDQLKAKALELGISQAVIDISSQADLEALIAQTAAAKGEVADSDSSTEPEAETKAVEPVKAPKTPKAPAKPAKSAPESEKKEEMPELTEAEKAELEAEVKAFKEEKIKAAKIQESLVVVNNVYHDGKLYEKGSVLDSHDPAVRIFIKNGWVE